MTDIPITLQYNQTFTVGECKLLPEVVDLLTSGNFKLEPGLMKVDGVWILTELSIVKDNSVDRKKL